MRNLSLLSRISYLFIRIPYLSYFAFRTPYLVYILSLYFIYRVS